MRFIRRSYGGKGWYNQSYRHALAAKGIKTSMSSKNMNFQGFDQNYEKMNKMSPEEMRGFSKFAEEMAKKLAMKKETRTYVGPETQAEKLQAERRAGGELKKYARRDWESLFSQIQQGPGLNIPNLAQTYESADPYIQAQITASAYNGAILRAQSRTPPDATLLSQLGLNKAQIDKVQREYNLAATGFESTRGERAGAGALKAAGGAIVRDIGAIESGVSSAEADLTKTMKRGAAELMKEETPAQRIKRLEDEKGVADRERRLKEVEWGAGEEGGGAFSFDRISGIGDVIKRRKAKEKEEGKEKTKEEEFWEKHPTAMRSEMEADDFFRNKASLAKADITFYDQGLKAFEKGDRESLIKAIFNLESENIKLKDRFSIVRKAKEAAVSRDSVTDTIHMANKSESGIMPNYFFGGGGGERIAKQTKKFNDVEDAIKQTSNKLVARISLLYQKLKKVDSGIKPDTSVPKKDIKVASKDYISLVAPFDDFQGQLKHQNPILEGIQTKSIKNPVFGAPKEMEPQQESVEAGMNEI